MSWILENLKKDPKSKDEYADLFISQIKEEPKTACLFTIGDARTVELILEKYKNTQFVVFDYPALINFLDFAKPVNLFKVIPLKYDWESEAEFLEFVGVEMQKASQELGEKRMFDLVIANPPYGKSSSLSKKIVNTLLEKKAAKEMVVLAPPKSFQDKLQTVVSKTDIGLTSDHFDIPVANGVKVFICKMVLDKKSNENWEHFLLSRKELMYLEAVENYNKDKVYPFETPGWITTYAKSKGILKDIDESRIVLFGIYYPKYLSAGWLQSGGEAEEHNLRGKAIRYHDSSSAPWALVFKTQEEAKGFCNFYYKGVEENKAGKVFTFGFSILRKLYGDDPSSKKYQTILPALDWSKSWTDEEILKEIGLPEDFLEEK